MPRRALSANDEDAVVRRRLAVTRAEDHSDVIVAGRESPGVEVMLSLLRRDKDPSPYGSVPDGHPKLAGSRRDVPEAKHPAATARDAKSRRSEG
jgi:hypothetical protein